MQDLEGKGEAYHMDKRTVMRIVERGMAQGRLVYCQLKMPASKSGRPDEVFELVCSPEFELREGGEVLEKV